MMSLTLDDLSLSMVCMTKQTPSPAEQTSPDVVASRIADEVRGEMARQRKTGVELAIFLGLTQHTVGRRLNGITPFTMIDLSTPILPSMTRPLGRPRTRSSSGTTRRSTSIDAGPFEVGRDLDPVLHLLDVPAVRAFPPAGDVVHHDVILGAVRLHASVEINPRVQAMSVVTGRVDGDACDTYPCHPARVRSPPPWPPSREGVRDNPRARHQPAPVLPAGTPRVRVGGGDRRGPGDGAPGSGACRARRRSASQVGRVIRRRLLLDQGR